MKQCRTNVYKVFSLTLTGVTKGVQNKYTKRSAKKYTGENIQTKYF